ncbi:DNA uptake protein ComE-like DNA-binding protein [Jejuia pallidilutea]|uniref:DNA uptake protein ComE-like DNA-binding protein n=1 Tax=Jejuia pallidilutea TaxID=504487 RepID=A0A362X0E6_9FLAO|nr:DNA uptake protein ComE-like DNA-binding protein [Jejuia pallidilutea]
MKSHFVFTKEQRNGIFLLLFIIIVLQCVYFFVDFSSEDITINNSKLQKYEAEMDALRQVEIEANKPKVYPFNPNYITDYKGSVIGMSSEEIDRLLNYRKQDKWINSAKQFQQVTGVSDSLLAQISPYFKFPEWVTQPKTKMKSTYVNTSNSFSQKTDLNKATALQLQKVNGIGNVLSKRIITYRETLKGGFLADIELQEVYGITPEIILKIQEHFTVKTPRKISKINLNTATVDTLVTIKHIDYEIAHNIVEYRKLHEGFSSLNELLKVKDFPISKIDIIKLSLHIQ